MKKDLETIRKEAIVGYSEYSDIELTDAGDGWAEGRVVIKPCHLNPSGAIHGGIIFCLADVIGGIACYTLDTLPVTVRLLYDSHDWRQSNLCESGGCQKRQDYDVC